MASYGWGPWSPGDKITPYNYETYKKAMEAVNAAPAPRPDAATASDQFDADLAAARAKREVGMRLGVRSTFLIGPRGLEGSPYAHLNPRWQPGVGTGGQDGVDNVGSGGRRTAPPPPTTPPTTSPTDPPSRPAPPNPDLPPAPPGTDPTSTRRVAPPPPTTGALGTGQRPPPPTASTGGAPATSTLGRRTTTARMVSTEGDKTNPGGGGGVPGVDPGTPDPTLPPWADPNPPPPPPPITRPPMLPLPQPRPPSEPPAPTWDFNDGTWVIGAGGLAHPVTPAATTTGTGVPGSRPPGPSGATLLTQSAGLTPSSPNPAPPGVSPDNVGNTFLTSDNPDDVLARLSRAKRMQGLSR